MSEPRPLTRRGVIPRAPIVPERVRGIGGQSFAFLPHRFLRHGFFASLRPDELRLYVLLVLAADRNGLSFYVQCAIMRSSLRKEWRSAGRGLGRT